VKPATLLIFLKKENCLVKWHVACNKKGKSNNSYLLSPEEGLLCPPRRAFFCYGPFKILPSIPMVC
jgi:hypothetical protein